MHLSSDNLLQYAMIAAAACLASLLLLGFVLDLIELYIYIRWSRRHRRTDPIHDDSDEDDDIEEQAMPGLDPLAIAAIPMREYRKEIGGPAAATAAECVVCLMAVEEGEFVRLLQNCKHIFHVECIDAWLHLNSTCPVCRAGASSSNDTLAAHEGTTWSMELAESLTSRPGSAVWRILSREWSERRPGGDGEEEVDLERQ